MCVCLGVSKFPFETLTPETLATRTPAFGTPALLLLLLLLLCVVLELELIDLGQKKAVLVSTWWY